jgi:hypothetical protein
MSISPQLVSLAGAWPMARVRAPMTPSKKSASIGCRIDIETFIKLKNLEYPHPSASIPFKPIQTYVHSIHPLHHGWGLHLEIAKHELRIRDGHYASGYPLSISAKSDIRIRWRIPSGPGGYPRIYPRISAPKMTPRLQNESFLGKFQMQKAA